MRRRKLLIGIGATAAGGSAAFGTEAFTSVQAERNVDVAVAGDQSSFIAIQPLDSANAGEYVNTESDNTVELELDGDNSGSGEGVTQDAITQLEDLFRVVNQGSQEVSVYFEDDSDAVTFRVTRSTETSTNGSNGQSLEGAANSVELGVGEQIVVGLTVDTLNNDVSGQLLDNVTLYADANASAPRQSIPEPQYVVDGDGDEPNTFVDLSSALGQASSGSVIGIEGGVSVTESGSVTVGTDDVTITGINGTPEIKTPSGLGGGQTFLDISGNGVTIRNLEITDDLSARGNAGGSNLVVGGDDAVVDSVQVTVNNGRTGNPALSVSGADPTVRNCELTDCVISAGGTGSVTVTGNFVTGAIDNGIFATSSADFTIENNQVNNHDTNDTNAKEIKFTSPATVNGESDTAAQMESLLTENSVNSVQVSGDAGTRATPDIVGSGEQFASINEVLKPGVQGGTAGGSSSQSALVALFEGGEYGSASNEVFDSAITHRKDNAVIKGLSKPKVTYTAMGEEDSTDVEIAGNDATVQDLDLVFTNVGGDSVGGEAFLDFTGADGTLQNVSVTYDPRSGAGGPTGYVNVSGSGTITFESCTFSDTSSGGSNRYVSANGLYDSDGTFELLNCEFNDGTRTDANVGSSGTAVYKENKFNATPAGGADSITGSMSGGELDITGNAFSSGAKVLFTSDLSGTVNGSSSGDNEAKATQLSENNGNVKVDVNFGGTVVGGSAQ
ncbi:hypothetical protein [Haloarcula marismortui]|uniref:Right handed beta helix domain-containing protein n=1 Tax=Haloarcula marismortui ATCC 33799 TaxID=662475 RepID=M0K163_9EURY|nr:hypothetical protein [Haloarcula californiae]EMA14951.1 hypothetical protein C435_14922 [Haloarcula californiae ATCC 33799]